ncbi:hypothetical protein [Stetteria hydrogenophila]
MKGALAGGGDTGRSAVAFRVFFTSTLNMLLAGSSVAFYIRIQEVEGHNLRLEEGGLPLPPRRGWA